MAGRDDDHHGRLVEEGLHRAKGCAAGVMQELEDVSGTKPVALMDPAIPCGRRKVGLTVRGQAWAAGSVLVPIRPPAA